MRLCAKGPNIQGSKGGLEMSSYAHHGLAALPIWAKAPLVSGGLAVLGPSRGLIVAGPGGRRRA